MCLHVDKLDVSISKSGRSRCRGALHGTFRVIPSRSERITIYYNYFRLCLDSSEIIKGILRFQKTQMLKNMVLKTPEMAIR